MKLLIIGSGASPYLYSLIESLSPFNVEIDFIDPYEGWVKEAGSSDKVYYAVGPLNQWNRRSQLKAILEDRNYDVCNIHYNSAFYGSMIGVLKGVADRLVVSIWGSDVRNSNPLVRALQKRTLAAADQVTINNPDQKSILSDTFGLKEDEVSIAFMPLQFLEKIDALDISREQCKADLGFSTELPVVLCGTNAREDQQHEEIIDSLRKYVSADEATFVFPLTYGKEADYMQRLLMRIEASPLNSVVLSDFLSDEDIIKLRLASDVVIQVQKQDMFSAVMQEALYAGSWVITGSWLPYKFLCDEVEGIRMVDSVVEVGKTVADCLKFKEQTNDKIVIRKIAGQESAGNTWGRILFSK